MRFTKYTFSLMMTVGLFLTACSNLQKDVNIELPPYERLLNVECYITPGVPIYLLFLTETVGYYEEFDLPIIEGASVTINYAGVTDTLFFGQPVIGTDTLTDFPVYYGIRSVTEDFPDSVFTLNVDDHQGREVSATTKLLPFIPIDTVEWEFNDKDKAYVLTRFSDPFDQENYYRRVLEKRVMQLYDNPSGGVPDTGWVTEVVQEFSFDDKILNGTQITLGTAFEFAEGDTLYSTIYHINEDYYDFLDTAEGAIIANFSPFAQPTRILSNIEGGTGVFTAISSDRVEFVIKR